MTNKFKLPGGLCTAYALACGYIDKVSISHDLASYDIEHYQEPACKVYQVRVMYTDADGRRTRMIWDSYDSVTKSRQRYNRLVKAHRLITTT
jgi:hypothetical protein